MLVSNAAGTPPQGAGRGGRRPNRRASAQRVVDCMSVREVLIDLALGQAARAGKFVGKHPQG